MFHAKRSPVRSTVAVYAACAIGCGAVLGLGVLAFKMSGGMVGPASAQAERSVAAVKSVQMSMLPTDSAVDATGVQRSRLNGAKAAPKAAVHTVAPVLIARVEPGGMIAPQAQSMPAGDIDSLNHDDLDEGAGYEPWSPDRTDTYRTVCVRLCDGAYFPMSFSTTRVRFKADAARCKSSCGAESRLFVVKPDGAPEDMVDVRGAGYIDLPNAFKFRSTYDESCRCHSQPWETAALERHRQLAAADAATPVAPAVRQQTLSATNAEGQPVMTKRTEGRIEIAVLDPGQLPVIGASKAEPDAVAAQTVPMPSAVTAPVVVRRVPHQTQVPRGPPTAVARPKVVKVAVLSAAQVKPEVVAAPVAVKKPVAGRARVASRVVVSRPTVRVELRRQVVEASTQRSFRSKDFWRLSYWDVRN